MAITLQELNVIIGADDTELRRKMTALQRSVQQLGDHLTGVGKKLTIGLTAPLAALGTISVTAAAQLDSLTRGLTSVAGSSEEAQKQLTRLQEVAKLPGLGFREAIQGSTRLQAAGFSAGLAEEALRGFGNALATVGAGKAELDQVTRALTQIAAKGKVSAEEINQLAEVVPQIRKVMEEAFGTANTELLQEAGIGAEEFITKVTAALNKLPQVTGGVQNSFENLEDALFRARAAIGEQLLPVIVPLVDGLATLAKDVRDLDPSTVRWGVALAGVAAVAGPLLIVVGSLTTAVTSLAAALGTGALLSVVSVGGPVLIGLAALSALFIKNKIDALAAKGAVDSYTQSLKALNQETAEEKFADLMRERLDLERQVGEVAEKNFLIAPSIQRTRAYAELNAKLRENAEQMRIVTQRLTHLRNEEQGIADTGNAVVTTTNAVTAAIDGETEALKRATVAAEGFNKAREEQARIKRFLEKPDVGLANSGVVPSLAGPIPPTPPAAGGGIMGALTQSLGGLVASLNPVTLGMSVLNSALGGLVTRGISFLTRGLGSMFGKLFGFGKSSERIARTGNTLAQTFEKINASANNLPEIIDLINRRRQLNPFQPPVTPPPVPTGGPLGGGPIGNPEGSPIVVHIHNPPSGMVVDEVARQASTAIVNSLRRGGTTELAMALRKG